MCKKLHINLQSYNNLPLSVKLLYVRLIALFYITFVLFGISPDQLILPSLRRVTIHCSYSLSYNVYNIYTFRVYIK